MVVSFPCFIHCSILLRPCSLVSCLFSSFYLLVFVSRFFLFSIVVFVFSLLVFVLNWYFSSSSGLFLLFYLLIALTVAKIYVDLFCSIVSVLALLADGYVGSYLVLFKFNSKFILCPRCYSLPFLLYWLSSYRWLPWGY